MDKLPYEILLKIFEYSGDEHLYKGLSQVNRHCRLVSQDETLWKNACLPLYIDMELSRQEINRVNSFRNDFYIQKHIDAQVHSLLLVLTRKEGHRYEAVKKIQIFGKRARKVLKQTIRQFGGSHAASISHIDIIYHAYRILGSIDRAFAVQTMISLWKDPYENSDVDLILSFDNFCSEHNAPDRLHYVLQGVVSKVLAELQLLKVDLKRCKSVAANLCLIVQRMDIGQPSLGKLRSIGIYLYVARRLGLDVEFCPLSIIRWVRVKDGENGEFYIDFDRARIRSYEDLLHVLRLANLPIIPTLSNKRSQLRALAIKLVSLLTTTLSKEHDLLIDVVFSIFELDGNPEVRWNRPTWKEVIHYPYDMLLYKVLEDNLEEGKIPGCLSNDSERIEKVLSFGKMNSGDCYSHCYPNDRPQFRLGQVVYVMSTDHFGVVFGWYLEGDALFYKVYGDKRHGARFVRETNINILPYKLDVIYELITWDNCGIGCYFSGYDVKKGHFLPTISLQCLYPDMNDSGVRGKKIDLQPTF